ncbi:MAG: lamin tail domain-containing protein [Myxococcales bacterium]|nr:lamin tail domain-containing protein [Myxococcales bacterium]
MREPLDRICPTLDAGALVITEIRGPQSGADTYGEWIELYNATDAPIRLGGITVTLYKLDGSGEFRFMVRDPDAEIAAGGYAVLAGESAADKDFVTYEYSSDEDGSLYAAAFVEVYSCEVLIDKMFYRALPSVGTLSLDGATTPDAAANESTDDPVWCVDETPLAPGEPATELGIRGTPGEANRPCP